MQDAINAASAGDTISVSGSVFGEGMTITTSDLTIVSTNTIPPLLEGSAANLPALVLDGAHDITISNFGMEGGSVPAVVMEASSNITLDSDELVSYNGLGPGTVTIDGSSSAVTISRSGFSVQGEAGGEVGVNIASGASNVTLASDIFTAYTGAGVEAGAVDGLDVVGDTIERSCGPAVLISGAATGVSIENNLFDDAITDPPYYKAGLADCTSMSLPWAADVSVAAAAIAGTTSDYNDFYSYGSDDSAPYDWAATTYPTLAAFQAATHQGAHDSVDSVDPFPIYSNFFQAAYVSAIPGAGSAALGSANTSAPGALDSDFYGVTPYKERGAIAIVDKATAALTVTDDSALTVTGAGNNSTAGIIGDSITDYSFAWGDGSTTTTAQNGVTHTYSARGTYTVSLTVTDAYGFTASTSLVISTAPDDDMVAQQTITDTSALSVADNASGSTGADGIAQYDFAWGDNQTTTAYSPTATHQYAKPGVYTVTLTVLDKNSDSATVSVSVTLAGSDYTAYGPVRLLDTRYGTGAPLKPVPVNGTVTLRVAGYGGPGGIPTDVTAVVLNLTVTNTHGSGFITAYDDGDPDGVPTVSNVNYVAGQTVPNLAIVPVGEDGDVDLTNGGTLAGNVDLIADVTGYFTQSSASGYTSLTPDRLVDTRNGTGVTAGQVGQNDTIAVRVAGADGGLLPSSGITAVALNVTVTNPKGAGFLTVYPDATPLPNASNVNYSQAQTIANSVIVPVASDGKIDITNSGTLAKGTDIVVDVVGYYDSASTSAYLPAEPTRLVDTRSAPWDQGPLLNGADNYFGLPLDLNSSFQPEPGVTALVLNATVTNTKGNGILTVAPDPNTYWQYENGYANLPIPPNSSSLNWTKGQTVPNLVQVSTGGTGIIDFWNLGAPAGSTDLIVDGFGYYQNS